MRVRVGVRVGVSWEGSGKGLTYYVMKALTKIEVVCVRAFVRARARACVCAHVHVYVK